MREDNTLPVKHYLVVVLVISGCSLVDVVMPGVEALLQAVPARPERSVGNETSNSQELDVLTADMASRYYDFRVYQVTPTDQTAALEEKWIPRSMFIRPKQAMGGEMSYGPAGFLARQTRRECGLAI